MNVAFLGATQGMGRALARLMAQRGDRLFLLGRDLADLQKSARDLEARAGAAAGSVGCAACDLERPETIAPALAAAEQGLGKLECAVVTAGAFAPQQQLEDDPELARRVLTVDFAHTVLFCE